MAGLSGDIWMVGQDPRMIADLGDHIEAQVNTVPGVCRSLTELSSVLAGGPAAAVFVDIEPDPVGTLASLEDVIARYPATRFVVLARQFSNDLVMEAMNAGARHFVPKHAISQELPRIIERMMHAATTGATSGRGAVVTVLSAGGGCGATTLAVNLARELTDGSGDRALLVDMDHAYGAVASYLGLGGEFGLGDVLSGNKRIDPQLIVTTAQQYTDAIHALINPVSIDPGRTVAMDQSRIDAAVDAASVTYPWTIVDAPRGSADVSVRLARKSRVTLIVSQFSVKDVRCARAIHETLTGHGVDERRILHVLNRDRCRHNLINITEARRALRDAPIELIRNDYRATVKGINLGEPLADCAPRSKARRDIVRLAGLIASMSGSPAQAPSVPAAAPVTGTAKDRTAIANEAQS